MIFAEKFRKFIEIFCRKKTSIETEVSAYRINLADLSITLSEREAWTLIGLVLHSKRQLLVHFILREKLRVDCHLPGKGLPIGGRVLGKPQSGQIPDCPDWSYFFHGIGICLSNRLTGERIDVDFHEGGVDFIDFHYFWDYLKSLRQPKFPEKNLLQLHPEKDILQQSILDLLKKSVLIPLEIGKSNLFQIRPSILLNASILEGLYQDIQGTSNQKFEAFAIMGDWTTFHFYPEKFI